MVFHRWPFIDKGFVENFQGLYERSMRMEPRCNKARRKFEHSPSPSGSLFSSSCPPLPSSGFPPIGKLLFVNVCKTTFYSFGLRGKGDGSDCSTFCIFDKETYKIIRPIRSNNNAYKKRDD
ncbi:hypothetical protein MTR_2g104950 [Medicago truncatula]|uniref:Uncharacterized protein n=1 Tax=Medicago truncatula TaxID=3880 RepID=A0A072VNA4_MEDTR|nr:hypothetical protein MTR_2g104950 [Medicago truncatula]